jgi:hypothetical protein
MRAEVVFKRIGEAVDRLMTVDVSSRGLASVLYEASRLTNENRPLALTAAERLAKATVPEQPVIIATGLPIRGWFSYAIAETDGPVGAATLARAVYVALNALPVLVCEEEQVAAVRACVLASGLLPTTFEELAAAKTHPDRIPDRPIPAAVVLGFPADPTRAAEVARDLLAMKPSGVISVERHGANAKGIYHHGRGEASNREMMAKIDLLFEQAKAAGVLTIGIGDGGNELGMGRIKDTIRKHVPFGSKCVCPCGIGMAPEFVPDVLVCATTSNWGAWGIEACLAAITGNTEALHSPEIEVDVIRACVLAGSVDGATGFARPLVDGMPASVCASMIHILQTIVANGLNPPGLYRRTLLALEG